MEILAIGFALLSVVLLRAEPSDGEREREAARDRHEPKAPLRERFEAERHSELPGRIEALVEGIRSNPQLRAELGITDEQITTLRDGFFNLRKQQVDLRAELEKSGLEQARLMTQSEIDEEAVMKVIDRAGKIRSDLAKSHVKGLLLLKRTLTQEQINGLKRLRERGPRKDNREEREVDREKRAPPPEPAPAAPAAGE
jgi:Spy/CpxP family protein refolding chaperone